MEGETYPILQNCSWEMRMQEKESGPIEKKKKILRIQHKICIPYYKAFQILPYTLLYYSYGMCMPLLPSQNTFMKGKSDLSEILDPLTE